MSTQAVVPPPDAGRQSAPAERRAAPDRSVPENGADLRRRGRFWLIAGFAVCPCHLPFTLLAVGAVAGGTAVGDAVTGNPVATAVALGTVTALAYRKGLRLLRAADACTANACRPTVRNGPGAADGGSHRDDAPAH